MNAGVGENGCECGRMRMWVNAGVGGWMRMLVNVCVLIAVLVYSSSAGTTKGLHRGAGSYNIIVKRCNRTKPDLTEHM